MEEIVEPTEDPRVAVFEMSSPTPIEHQIGITVACALAGFVATKLVKMAYGAFVFEPETFEVVRLDTLTELAPPE